MADYTLTWTFECLECPATFAVQASTKAAAVYAAEDQGWLRQTAHSGRAPGLICPVHPINCTLCNHPIPRDIAQAKRMGTRVPPERRQGRPS